MPEVEGQWRSLGTVSVLGETLVPITPRLWAAMMTCRTTDQTRSYCKPIIDACGAKILLSEICSHELVKHKHRQLRPLRPKTYGVGAPEEMPENSIFLIQVNVLGHSETNSYIISVQARSEKVIRRR